MNLIKPNFSVTGTSFALTTALLFGMSTPLAKLFLEDVQPLMLAGLMYLGGGIGLAPVWLFYSRHRKHDALQLQDWRWLLGSLCAGGLFAPVLLMTGLSETPAAVVSLLLNFESVFTAVVAWTIFREPWHWRVLLGIAIITVGGILISQQHSINLEVSWGALAILGTCFAWAIDSNLTAQIASRNPIQLAAIKSGGAGLVNVVIALFFGQSFPSPLLFAKVSSAGFLCYGLTYCCFVMALRYIGPSRTGAFFAISPLVGATLAIVFLDDLLTQTLVIAATLMTFGALLCAWEPAQPSGETDIG